MPKPWSIAILLVAGSLIAHAQTQNFWQILGEVGFQSKKGADGFLIETPVFGKNLKSWNGKKIRLKGYVIPVSEVGDQDKVMLSSLPFNVCYFCGAAGPETVIEVESGENIRFTTKAIFVEGVLQLNDSDRGHHMYILKSAQLVALPSADSRSRFAQPSK